MGTDVSWHKCGGQRKTFALGFVGVRDETQLVRLGGTYLYPLCYLVGP